MATRSRFEAGIAATRDDLRRMAALTESALAVAEEAVAHPHPEARQRVREIERTIDGLEVAIEARCHELMALEAPVAVDMRLLVSALRIATDLEHIGDLAQGVAKRMSSLADAGPLDLPDMLGELAIIPRVNLAIAIEAFESGALDGIERVAAAERRSDALAKVANQAVQAAMIAQPTRIRDLTQALRAIYHLEEAADTCVCIAEEAVFFHTGHLLRHQRGTGRFEKA